MIVKNSEEESQVTNLEDILRSIRDNNMVLNLAKFLFGMQTGKILGFMLPTKGVEVKPNKCQVIINMRIPSSIKEV